MRSRTLAVIAVIPFLAACASSGSGPVQGAGVRPAKPPKASQAVRAPSRYKPRAPQVQILPGIQGVIGSNPAQLTRQFGSPRLDVWEGDARKLQFSGNSCVLDVYLYPPEAGGEPQATYVDARTPADGQEMDRAACIAALRQSPNKGP